MSNDSRRLTGAAESRPWWRLYLDDMRAAELRDVPADVPAVDFCSVCGESIEDCECVLYYDRRGWFRVP